MKPKPSFTFIDLFAGIGGIRIAFTKAGGECVFSSEYDRYSQKTYEAFFGERPDFSKLIDKKPELAFLKGMEKPGDITRFPPDSVPDHDILTGGFPCQPFSLAGVSKKQSLGRAHGFDDPTQGTLFFNIKEIIIAKQPRAFLLENVKNLKSHDHRRTWKVIRQTLEDLGYIVFDRVIDSAGWVPQHRERIYIVGFRLKDQTQEWEITDFPEFYDITPPDPQKKLETILEPAVPDRYTLGPGTWNTLIRHKMHHESIGQGFGYGLISPPFDGKITRTLSARYHKDGAEILIDQGEGKRPRRLTPLECCRLMGFDQEYQDFFDRAGDKKQPVSDTQAYRQFGNSVVVPVVEIVADTMVERLVRAGAITLEENSAAEMPGKEVIKQI